MSYTNAMSVAIPAGSVAANLIDDHIRQTRLDFKERLATVFADLDVDPLALKPSFITYLQSIISSAASLGVRAHWSDGHFVSITTLTEVTGVTKNQGYIAPIWDSIGITTLVWCMPLHIPTGGVFDTLTCKVYRDAGAAVTLTLYRSNSGADTQIATVTSASTGWHDLALSLGGNITVVVDNTYYLLVSLATNAGGTAFGRLQSVLVDL